MQKKLTKPKLKLDKLPLKRLEDAKETIVKVIEEGKGEKLKSGDFIEVHYLGALKDGEEFDNSYDRGDTLKFPLGTGKVIKGWDEALVGRRVGDKLVLLIPSDLGYGERGAGNVIPPHADLIFYTEIVSKSKNV